MVCGSRLSGMPRLCGRYGTPGNGPIEACKPAGSLAFGAATCCKGVFFPLYFKAVRHSRWRTLTYITTNSQVITSQFVLDIQ